MMQQRNRNLFVGKQERFQGTSRSGCQVGLDSDADPLLLICFQWPSPRQWCQLMLERSCAVLLEHQHAEMWACKITV